MKALLLALALSVLTLACGPIQTPDQLTKLERATVAIIHSELDEENDQLTYFLACAGVAIGPRTILTAGHCVDATGAQALFADADTFLTTGSGKETANVEQLPGDRALLTPTRDLEHWVGTAAPPASGTVDIVRLYTSNIVTEPAQIDGERFLSPMVDHGQSGSPLGVGDVAIGVVLTCTSPDDKMCAADGGSFGLVP